MEAIRRDRGKMVDRVNEPALDLPTNKQLATSDFVFLVISLIVLALWINSTLDQMFTWL
jgi:hypothetical protein